MLFRYPGSKNKIADRIVSWFQRHYGSGKGPEYREPFFGGGAVGLALMKAFPDAIKNVWLNDYDPNLCCVWDSVVHDHEELIRKLHTVQTHHLDKFQHPREPERRFMEPRFKPRPGDPDDLAAYLNLTPKERKGVQEPESYADYVKDYLQPFYDIQSAVKGMDHMPPQRDRRTLMAFCKIMLHQTSYSGLGTASGPIGGKDQRSDWIMGCRYMPETTEKKIRQVRTLLSGRNFHDSEVCTNLDFMELLKTPGDCVFYLDPPYYNQGHKLYRETFRQKHEELAEWLVTEDRPWLLSYDNAPQVRALYSAPHLEMHAFPLRYTVTRYRNEDGSAVEKMGDESKWELVVTNVRGSLDPFFAQVACTDADDPAE